MTKANPARPGLSPLDVPQRVTSLVEKIAALLDRLDGKTEPSWRDDMDVSIAWRFWFMDAHQAGIDPVAALLTHMPGEHYDRAYQHIFSLAKAVGIAPGRPQSTKKYLDLYLSSLRTIPVVEAGQLLGIGRNKSYELAKSGGFPVPVREIAGKLRVLLLDIENLLLNQPAK